MRITNEVYVVGGGVDKRIRAFRRSRLSHLSRLTVATSWR